MNTCWLCGSNGCADPLDRHHIFGGANRKKSERMGLVVYLCHNRCHIFGRYSAHQNKETMLKLHQFAIMCAPTTSQLAAVKALRDGADDVEMMMAEFF